VELRYQNVGRKGLSALDTLAARRSKLDPIKRVAKTIREHLWGIANAIVHNLTNGFDESVNSKIQLVKSRARSYRTYETFRVAILFYCGNLDLYPRASH